LKLEKTNLEDCFILSPKVFEDERGTFSETFNAQKFLDQTGVAVAFVQDNESTSKYGVVRGLHFQTGVHGQTKLVRVVKGSALDVVVDLRKGSPSFGKSFSIVLSGENKKQLFVPHGFAHGFSVLEDDTVFSYKCDAYYNKESERGIVYNDATLAIDWHLSSNAMIVSKKDLELPTFAAIKPE
jgi:dTDP-4-dehydrorhamnose 3,5-epimerase